jgi:flagellar biosynthesis protein FlhG
MNEYIQKKPQIWAVGGGKGGTGKSFVTCNIATCLAGQGKRTLIIDADFGGANLHTLLGVSKSQKSLADFFSKKALLRDLIVDTKIENLHLIVGPLRYFEPESIKYAQKIKLFNHIRRLRADVIIIDLGSGSHFNIVDTFLLADKKVVVTLPQITALENMFSFLNNAFFRSLNRAFVQHKLGYIFKNAVQEKAGYELGHLRQFIAKLREKSAEANEIIDDELSKYMVNIIINQAKTSKDISLGNQVRSLCIKYLGFKANYIGYIEQDDTIPRAINKQQPYLQMYPKSKCATKIEKITLNLLDNTQMRVQ